MVVYRAVKANDSDDVIAIGADENQGGQPYNDMGVWCEFTFEEIPQPEGKLLDYINENDYRGSTLKVSKDKVVLKTIKELK